LKNPDFPFPRKKKSRKRKRAGEGAEEGLHFSQKVADGEEGEDVEDGRKDSQRNVGPNGIIDERRKI
jgi:hypothetical protein